jgi:diaminopimelate decarboxylase
MNKDSILNLANKYGTPLYIAYPDLFKKNIQNFRNAFLSHYDKVILAYSLKTNYTPVLLETICTEGKCFYAETVSDAEYGLAQKAGFDGKRIILNGPVKSRALLLTAIRQSSIIHLDCEYEVDDILSIQAENPTLKIKVGLRVNMEINTSNGESALQNGLQASRFGFTERDLSLIIPKLKKNGIIINALHGHTTSINRVVENYKIIAKRLLEVCNNYNLNDIEFLDMGGSFFGAAPLEINASNKPSYQDYATGICDVLLADEFFCRYKPFIVIEPGTSVVCNVFEFLTKIYQHKVIKNKHYVIVDGTEAQVRLLFSKTNFPFEEVSLNAPQKPIKTMIVGSTCMEIDILANDVNLSHYRNGDLLLFKAEGAYRINMTPYFINRRVPIIEISEDGSEKRSRKRQSIEEFCKTVGI